MAKIKVVHYVNQFYAGIGGEEKADITPELREGTVPTGDALNKAWAGEAEITHTIVCGDSYFGENMDKASAEIMEMVKSVGADMFIAGPAFNAGRYGVACGTIATNVKNTLGIPVLTGMYVENPGVDMYKTQIYIVATKDSGAGMRDAIKKMAPLALKLARNEKIEASCVEGYIPNGVRVNLFEKECGAVRAVKMLIAKLNDKPYVTEFPMPDFDRVEPNPAILDMSKAVVALCTSGGSVPKGNPDRIESSSASKYGEYDITGVNSLDGEHWETAHGGYDPVYINEDGNRCLPVDILREMEASGRIGKLHNKFYTTVGNGTAVLSSKAFAEEYAKKMVDDGVDCVIMTST
jgi:glycine reductase